MRQLYAAILSAGTVGGIWWAFSIDELFGWIALSVLAWAILYRVSLLSLSHKNDGKHQQPARPNKETQ